MAEKIDHIERIKPTVSFDVAWSDKIGLMNVINVESLCKIGIFDTLGSVSSFF